MNGARYLTVRVLREPRMVCRLRMSEWDLLIRQARRAEVLARLQVRLDGCGLLDRVPVLARRHLDSARRVAEKHASVVRWEIERLREALKDTGVPIILLKGAAYVAAGLPPAAGRVFSDLDIMVPKGALDRVEQRLMIHGWISDTRDSYGQRYYRRWMHEIPPLRHRKRNTVLDVHHNILPETSRYRVDASLIHSAATPIGVDPELRILAPADMVLHSAAHLFGNGEFDRALRDLADLDDLLRHFGGDSSFWPALAARACELGLERPLAYALRESRRLFGTEIPNDTTETLDRARPGRVSRALMSPLLERALVPAHPSCDRAFTGLARWLLYVRGHYLRMPLPLLVPHLLRKAWRREEGRA
jgi:hypothetical protein